MKLTYSLSEKVTTLFVAHQIIPAQSKNIYLYCFDLVFYNLSLLLIGCFFHEPFLALLYIFTMTPLKMLAGGMHAKSRSMCDVISYLTYFLCLLYSIRMPFHVIWSKAEFIIFCIALILIIHFAPVDTSGKRLDALKKQRLKRITMLYSAVLFLTFILLRQFADKRYTSLMMICTVIIVANQLIGFLVIKRRKEDIQNESEHCNM